MYFTPIFSAFAVMLCVAAVPFKNDTAAPTPTLTHGNLIARTVTSLPASAVTCSSGTEGGQTFPAKAFNKSEIKQAAQQGLDNLANKNTYGNYPKTFKNREGFIFANCAAGSAFYEYPILRDGTVFTGGVPGAYRVIFLNSNTPANGDGEYCGLIYHKTDQNNNFDACT